VLGGITTEQVQPVGVRIGDWDADPSTFPE